MFANTLKLHLQWPALGYEPGTCDMYMYDEAFEHEIRQANLNPNNAHHLFEYLNGMRVVIGFLQSGPAIEADSVRIIELVKRHYTDFRIGLGYFVPDLGFENPHTIHHFDSTPFSGHDNWTGVIARIGPYWEVAEAHLVLHPDVVASLDRLCAEQSEVRATYDPRNQLMRCEESYCRLVGQLALIESARSDKLMSSGVGEAILKVLMVNVLLHQWPRLTPGVRKRIKHSTG